MSNMNISELVGQNAPFEDDLGITDEMYIPIVDLKNIPIVIRAVKAFENDKGPGVYIAFEKGGSLYSTTTHSIGIVDVLGKDTIVQALKDGKQIECAVVEKTSKKTGNKFLMLE